MRNIVNSQQTRLFDSFNRVLAEKLANVCSTADTVFSPFHPETYAGVDIISGHFNSTMGRPTTELYSIAELLLIQEFMDWTKDEALDANSFNMNVHYALNLEPVTHDIGMRTLERYVSLFEEDAIAKVTMA